MSGCSPRTHARFHPPRLHWRRPREAAEWADCYAISVDVLADPEETLAEGWGGEDGSQHGYTAMDSARYVTFRQDDGCGGEVNKLTGAVTEAE